MKLSIRQQRKIIAQRKNLICEKYCIKWEVARMIGQEYLNILRLEANLKNAQDKLDEAGQRH